ncbi:MAG: hypothetical protein PVS3B3_22280 [Ktedonobacteraceae bacterium]
MKEVTRRSGSVVTVRREGERNKRRRIIVHCSICNGRVWFHPLRITEPEGVPEPRLSWTLCKPCYRALLDEMRVSPVRSPLRLRVAIGIVASERWPQAYSTRVRMYLADRRLLVFIAVGLIMTMIVHLAILVSIAALH